MLVEFAQQWENLFGVLSSPLSHIVEARVQALRQKVDIIKI